jgi:3D (Asp-Asp-Asp) domain-containing protein
MEFANGILQGTARETTHVKETPLQGCPVWLILLVIALSLGSDPVISPTARGAWARPASPRNAPQLRPARTSRLRVTVTAYSRGRPTASGHRVRPGMIALSRDIERALGVTFGERVVLEGVGTFVFADRVSARHRRRADIFIASPRAARRFGVKVIAVRVARGHVRVLPLFPPLVALTTARVRWAHGECCRPVDILSCMRGGDALIFLMQ